MLDTVAQADNSCVARPCCVVEKPAAPPPGQNWFLWLVDGFAVRGRRPAG